MVSSWIVCRPSCRWPRQPRGPTTSSSRMGRLPSLRPPRRCHISVARNWRRLARRKSFSTSARGNPVSGNGPPAGDDSRHHTDRATSLTPPRVAPADEASGIVVEFSHVPAQPDDVVFDLHSVAHIPDCAHVYLPEGGKIRPRITDARRK